MIMKGSIIPSFEKIPEGHAKKLLKWYGMTHKVDDYFVFDYFLVNLVSISACELHKVYDYCVFDYLFFDFVTISAGELCQVDDYFVFDHFLFNFVTISAGELH